MKSIHTYRFICILISLEVLFLLVQPILSRASKNDNIDIIVETSADPTYILEPVLIGNLKADDVDDHQTTESEVEESEIEVVKSTEIAPTAYCIMTDEEVRDFAALLWIEARGEPEEVKYAVASVILNRVTLYKQSLHDVIYAPNQFSPADYVAYTDPTEDEIRIVNDVLQTGPTIPEYVCYFRAGYYHSWSGMNDYGFFGGNTYFSYSDEDFLLFCNG